VINLDLSFVIQLINFLVLILILNVFLYKPLRKVLAERKDLLSGAKARAAQVDEDVARQMAEYEERLKAMKAETGAERGELKKEAQTQETAILEKARTEATQSLESIKAKVAKEAAEARALLQEQAKALSGEICEKVLGRSL
jgi:F-type H+-transporting ATPase subunit b